MIDTINSLILLLFNLLNCLSNRYIILLIKQQNLLFFSVYQFSLFFSYLFGPYCSIDLQHMSLKLYFLRCHYNRSIIFLKNSGQIEKFNPEWQSWARMTNSAQNDKFSTEWQNKSSITNSPQNDNFNQEWQVQPERQN